MKVKAAYEIALNSSVEFCKHDEAVRAAKKQFDNAVKNDPSRTRVCVDATPCLIFAIDDEYFYYGFDGTEIQIGKCSKKAAARHRKDGFGLTIRSLASYTGGGKA